MSKYAKRLKESRESEEGFALPLVLISGAVIASTLLAALAVSISNNNSSRVRLLTSLADSAVNAVVTNYRSFLNDATYGHLFSYYWLVQGCGSGKLATDCPKDNATGTRIGSTGIQNPSSSYWSNNGDGFCNGFAGVGCLGRQIAPTCTYANPNQGNNGAYLDWQNPTYALSQLFTSQKDLSRGTNIGGTNKQYGIVSSYETVGQIEQGGRGQLDVSGIIKDGSTLKAERRIRQSMEIERSTPYSGFAFISAGIDQSDINSIHLGNLEVHDKSYGGGLGRGTILLRHNMSNYHSSSLRPNNCRDMKDIFFYNSLSGINYSLPTRGNGGLLVHSPYWPSSQSLVTTPLNPATEAIRNTSSSSCLRVNSQKERIYEYNNLFILRGARYCIETSDTSKALIRVADSLHVAAGAVFCHVNQGSSVCGSGKPENLTVASTYKDYTLNKTPVSSHTGCSVPRGGNGTGEVYSDRSINGSPGPTFTFQSTGRSSSGESFSGFIYGKDLVFTSAGVSKSRYGYTSYLANDLDSRYAYSSALVIHRGRQSVTNLEGTADYRVWALVSPWSRVLLINGDASRSRLNGMNPPDYYLENKSIIGVVERSRYGDVYASWGYYIPETIYITNDWRTNYMHIHSAYKLRYPSGSQGTNGLIQLNTQISRDIQTPYGTIPRSFPASQAYRYYTPLKIVYGLGISAANTNDMDPNRVYQGAVWARKVCFSQDIVNGNYLRQSHWVFQPTFVDGLSQRYGDAFRWGMSNYKSRFTRTWDILRDFFS